MDILAHPRLIQLGEARLAVKNGGYLEVSGRKGHSFANGHVVTVARKAGVELLRNSDAHEPEVRLAQELADRIAVGAGLNV